MSKALIAIDKSGSFRVCACITTDLVQEAANIIENMPKKNQQIVLELLRAMNSQSAFDEITKKHANEQMRAAAFGLAGLWSGNENELPVDEVVREMRRGRRFDN